MIFHIYANFNNLGGFFGEPMIDHIEPEEIVKDYVQIIVGVPVEALQRLKECDLYCLGSIDNVTGEVVAEKTFLLHCGDFVSRFLKEEKEDGSAKDC